MNNFRYADMIVYIDGRQSNVTLLRACDRFKGPHKQHYPLPSIETDHDGDRLILTIRTETKEQYNMLVCQLFERLGGNLKLRGLHYDIMKGDGYHEGRLIIDF